jgi:hypothetical protein
LFVLNTSEELGEPPCRDRQLASEIERIDGLGNRGSKRGA